jgi:hypothetical protein
MALASGQKESALPSFCCALFFLFWAMIIQYCVFPQDEMDGWNSDVELLTEEDDQEPNDIIVHCTMEDPITYIEYFRTQLHFTYALFAVYSFFTILCLCRKMDVLVPNIRIYTVGPLLVLLNVWNMVGAKSYHDDDRPWDNEDFYCYQMINGIMDTETKAANRINRTVRAFIAFGMLLNIFSGILFLILMIFNAFFWTRGVAWVKNHPSVMMIPGVEWLYTMWE